MIKINRCEEELLNGLRHIKNGHCPNFFVTGKSISALERMGETIVECLEMQQAMDFRGICKHFTIMMPYFDSKTNAMKFMDHLLNSISIARDCYDTFQGIILLEFSMEWSKEGVNDCLDVFWDFAQKNLNICFVLLLPQPYERTNADGFFAEFFRCGNCIKIECETATVHQNVAFFESLALDRGYTLSDEAKQFVYQRMKERDETMVDNRELLLKLLDQIIFDMEYKKTKRKEINVTDLCCYLPAKSTATTHKVGFIR